LHILVIAAHPDDEVLGMGATIKKLSEKGNQIHLCIISEGASAQYSDSKMIKVRKESCEKSGKILGILSIDFLDFPDMKLDSIPQLEINKKLEKIISKYKPKVVYTTPNHDMNTDHQRTFDCTLVATRAQSSGVKQIFCYEIPGSTKIPFQPNYFEDVTQYFESKINAFKKYESEVEEFPHPRSLEALENLAKIRGLEVGLKKAEAFCLIRSIN